MVCSDRISPLLVAILCRQCKVIACMTSSPPSSLQLLYTHTSCLFFPTKQLGSIFYDQCICFLIEIVLSYWIYLFQSPIIGLFVNPVCISQLLVYILSQMHLAESDVIHLWLSCYSCLLFFCQAFNVLAFISKSLVFLLLIFSGQPQSSP